MRVVTAAEVAAWTGGKLIGRAEAAASAFSSDSRSLAPGSAFVAVRSGHEFTAQALAAGAAFVLVDRPQAVPAGATGVVTSGVVEALGKVAQAVRAEASYMVIGVTGSFGKTLTKDFLAAALATSIPTHATPASYNAELGVPLVVLSSPPGTQALVAELGARRPGEIAALCEIVRPQAGVLTGVGSTHLELFGTRAQVARTKSELLEALPAGGFGVVPADDDFLPVFSDASAAKTVTVGAGGAVRYLAERVDRRGRTHGWVSAAGDTVSVELPVGGRGIMRNAALAIAAAAELGVAPHTAAEAIAASRPSAWRMELLDIGGRTIVNDAYNANPTSTASALRTVAEMAETRQAWAVLGEMAELGEISEHEHERIGRLAVSLGYSGVVVVGGKASPIERGAGAISHRVGSLAEAAEAISGRAAGDAIVLVKASRAAGLEKLLDLLSSGPVGERT